jgi:hypothetical protein
MAKSVIFIDTVDEVYQEQKEGVLHLYTEDKKIDR